MILHSPAAPVLSNTVTNKDWLQRHKSGIKEEARLSVATLYVRETLDC